MTQTPASGGYSAPASVRWLNRNEVDSTGGGPDFHSPGRHPGLRAQGDKSQWSARIEFLGVTVTFLAENDEWADRVTGQSYQTNRCNRKDFGTKESVSCLDAKTSGEFEFRRHVSYGRSRKSGQDRVKKEVGSRERRWEVTGKAGSFE